MLLIVPLVDSKNWLDAFIIVKYLLLRLTPFSCKLLIALILFEEFIEPNTFNWKLGFIPVPIPIFELIIKFDVIMPPDNNKNWFDALIILKYLLLRFTPFSCKLLNEFITPFAIILELKIALFNILIFKVVNKLLL